MVVRTVSFGFDSFTNFIFKLKNTKAESDFSMKIISFRRRLALVVVVFFNEHLTLMPQSELWLKTNTLNRKRHKPGTKKRQVEIRFPLNEIFSFKNSKKPEKCMVPISTYQMSGVCEIVHGQWVNSLLLTNFAHLVLFFKEFTILDQRTVRVLRAWRAVASSMLFLSRGYPGYYFQES